MTRFDKGRSIDPRLLGQWQTDPADAAALLREGNVRMEFEADGSLTYSIDAGDKWQQIYLVYRTEGIEIVTDQPSQPREDRTEYSFTPEGKLVLDYGGVRSRYVRRA